MPWLQQLAVVLLLSLVIGLWVDGRIQPLLLKFLAELMPVKEVVLAGPAVQRASPPRRTGPGPKISLIGALVAALIAGAFFVRQYLMLPTLDHQSFDGRKRVSILFGESPARPAAKVETQYPVAIPAGEEATVDVADDVAVPFSSRPAELESSSDVAVRKESAANSLAHASRWHLKGKEPGSSNVTVTLPLERPGFPAVATLKIDNVPVVAMFKPDGTPWNPGESREGIERRLVTLTPAHPVYGERDFTVDIRRMTLDFRLVFLTTLGVTAHNYALLAVVGTILAALLGSGLIWKFVKSPASGRDDE
ncbi:MAG TPA: hypothetical protein VG936_00925 [Lacunisphaera sp.]|nr:hypothetical protein [Lacunisphaera sp.]